MTARTKDLKDALQAIIDSPSDAAAIAKAKRLLNDETVKIPVSDLTNDELKLQQGVGAAIAATTVPGTAISYGAVVGADMKHNSIENPVATDDRINLMDLHDAVGKIPDYTGAVDPADADSKLGEYVSKLSEKQGEEAASNVTPSDKEVKKAVEEAPEVTKGAAAMARTDSPAK